MPEHKHDTMITDSLNTVELNYCDLKVIIGGADDIAIFPSFDESEEWHIETDSEFLKQILLAVQLAESTWEDDS